MKQFWTSSEVSRALGAVFAIVAMVSVQVYPAAAQGWQPLGSSSDGSIWSIDLSRSYLDKGLVRYWIRQETPGTFFTGKREQITSNAANCVRRQYTIVSLMDRDGSGKVLTQGTRTEAEWQFIEPIPGSISESAMIMACRIIDKKLPSKPSVLLERLPQKPDWEFLVQAPDQLSRVSYSPASVVDMGSGVYSFVANSAFVTPQPNANGEPYVFIVFAASVDCNTNKWSITGQEFVTADFRVIDSAQIPEAYRKYQLVEAGSPVKKVRDRVCTKAPPKSSKAETPSESEEIGSGTGWIVGGRYIVTADHVVKDSSTILIYGADKKPRPAKVVLEDAANDVAVLDADIAGSQLASLQLATASPALGTRVFTIGFPLIDMLGVAPKFTAGEVSSLSGLGDDPRSLQVSVPIQPGNSGGPLLNESGEVVGIITSTMVTSAAMADTGTVPQNINYAIKSRYVAGLLQDLKGGLNSRSSDTSAKSFENVVERAKRAVVLVITSKTTR